MEVAPHHSEIKTKLAEVYEITGQLQKALDLVDQGFETHFIRVHRRIFTLPPLSHRIPRRTQGEGNYQRRNGG